MSRLTLDEAINHCLEQARSLQDKADTLTGEESRNCMECAADHIQLAEWLRGLKNAKELLRDIKSYYKSDSECKEYKCADCIHFDECGCGKQHPDGYKWRFEDNVNVLIGGSNESKD